MSPLPRFFLVWFLSAAAASASWQITESRTPGSLGSGAGVREVRLSGDGQSARLTAVVFSEKAFTLRVVDSPSPGGTKLARVLPDASCIAGVNGGFFQADFRPVGLMVADGKEVHPFEKAKLLSGVLTVRGNRIEIVRSGAFKRGNDLRQAIQCGPMLIENGLPVAGLNGERIARRTVVATDGRGHWAMIYLTSVNLADAALILSTPGVTGDWTVRTALNLDGGPSSGLWAASTPEQISLPEFGSVRNFIGIQRR